MASLLRTTAPLASTVPKFRVEPKTHALVVLHYAFPIVLLSFFFVVFATWSIYAVPVSSESLLKSASKPSHANGANGNGDATPNGDATKADKPKTVRKAMLGRKTRALFNWALVGVMITYVRLFYHLFRLRWSVFQQHRERTIERTLTKLYG